MAPGELRRAEIDHRDAVELALTAANADARWRDYEGALRWLGVAERLNLALPVGYAEKRRRWRDARRSRGLSGLG